MRIQATLPDHGILVEYILEGFVLAAAEIIASGVVPPFPQQTGVRYSEESAGSEVWKLPNQVMRDNVGDCEDLCIWEAAGMRVTGQDPGARCILVMTGARKVHCLVMLTDGRMSDPSLQISKRQKALSLGGGVTITDHRTGNTKTGRLGTDSGLPPAAAAPGGGTPYVNPYAGLTKWMKENPNSGKQNDDGSRTVSFSDDVFLREHGYQGGLKGNPNKAQLDAYFGPRGEALAIAARNKETISKAFNQWGRGVRTDGPPAGWVQDPVTGQWQPGGAGVDPLAEYGQSPQAPWGGGYGGGYGYGGDYGYGGYGQSGWGSYGGYYEDSPLLTYADLYGWGDPAPDYVEEAQVELLDDNPDNWFSMEEWL